MTGIGLSDTAIHVVTVLTATVCTVYAYSEGVGLNLCYFTSYYHTIWKGIRPTKL